MRTVNLQNLIDYSKTMNEPDPLYGIDLPQPLDNEKCRSAILMRCGLLEPVYNDPRVFREMIYTWFHIRDWNFKHLIAIIQAEYSPIENTDRYSEHTIKNSGSDSRKYGGSDSRKYGGSDETKRSASDTVNGSSEDSASRTENGTDSRTRTPNLQSLTIDEISAENAYDYQPDSQHRTSESGSETNAGTSSEESSERRNGSRTETGSHSSTETNSYGKTETDSYGKTETGSRNGQETYTEHTHGNIGVTSNVQLINEETSLIRRFNVYDWIAERIEETFFIMVY